MESTQANHFGEALGELLTQPRTMPLGPGRANRAAEEALRALTVERAFAGRVVADEAMARAAIAGVWLYHDFLEESHTISQSIRTSTGSYWHGIMHRREPDYPNAKHWFGNTGEHPVFPPLREDAAVLAKQSADPRAAAIAEAPHWDPFGFVDLCEEAAKHPEGALADLCVKVQMREWWLLFEYCYLHAIGQSGPG